MNCHFTYIFLRIKSTIFDSKLLCSTSRKKQKPSDLLSVGLRLNVVNNKHMFADLMRTVF